MEYEKGNTFLIAQVIPKCLGGFLPKRIEQLIVLLAIFLSKDENT
jgi:hypothetical protein